MCKSFVGTSTKEDFSFRVLFFFLSFLFFLILFSFNERHGEKPFDLRATLILFELSESNRQKTPDSARTELSEDNLGRGVDYYARDSELSFQGRPEHVTS